MVELRSHCSPKCKIYLNSLQCLSDQMVLVTIIGVKFHQHRRILNTGSPHRALTNKDVLTAATCSAINHGHTESRMGRSLQTYTHHRSNRTR
jgi:hypothetical protein